MQNIPTAPTASLFDRFAAYWIRRLNAKPEPEVTTRPEWIQGYRPPLRRPFRAHREGSFYDRPPVSYGPYHPYNLD